MKGGELNMGAMSRWLKKVPSPSFIGVYWHFHIQINPTGLRFRVLILSGVR